ncbi:MAG: hypothetical protein ACRCTA_03095, partial [Bacilli bacterium]
EVSIKEAYDYNRKQTIGQATSKIINKDLLEKDYGYKNNEKVKDLVDVEIRRIKESNPNLVKDYGVKDEYQLLDQSGQILSIMEKQYVKDLYIKENVTDASLKELYDNHEGETVSYYELKLSIADFEFDSKKYEDALNDVTKHLKDLKKGQEEEVFKKLVKKYPGAKNSPNGYKDGLNRESVNATLLIKLDTMQNHDYTKEPLEIETNKYFILKINNAQRDTFEVSKTRLSDLQYDKAIQSNQYLSEKMLLDLRNKQELTFNNPADEKEYQLYNKSIIDGYDKALAQNTKTEGSE